VEGHRQRTSGANPKRNADGQKQRGYETRKPACLKFPGSVGRHGFRRQTVAHKEHDSCQKRDGSRATKRGKERGGTGNRHPRKPDGQSAQHPPPYRRKQRRIGSGLQMPQKHMHRQPRKGQPAQGQQIEQEGRGKQEADAEPLCANMRRRGASPYGGIAFRWLRSPDVPSPFYRRRLISFCSSSCCSVGSSLARSARVSASFSASASSPRAAYS